jgi:hypothetical protein
MGTFGITSKGVMRITMVTITKAIIVSLQLYKYPRQSLLHPFEGHLLMAPKVVLLKSLHRKATTQLLV